MDYTTTTHWHNENTAMGKREYHVVKAAARIVYPFAGPASRWRPEYHSFWKDGNRQAYSRPRLLSPLSVVDIWDRVLALYQHQTHVWAYFQVSSHCMVDRRETRHLSNQDRVYDTPLMSYLKCSHFKCHWHLQLYKSYCLSGKTLLPSLQLKQKKFYSSCGTYNSATASSAIAERPCKASCN